MCLLWRNMRLLKYWSSTALSRAARGSPPPSHSPRPRLCLPPPMCGAAGRVKYTLRAARPGAEGASASGRGENPLNHGLNLLVSLFFAQSHGPPDPDRHPSPLRLYLRL